MTDARINNTVVKAKPPTNRQWNKAVLDVALTVAHIEKCRACEWPIIKGNYCTYCGSGR